MKKQSESGLPAEYQRIEERGRDQNQETHYGKGKRSEVIAGANQDFAMGECMCAAYMCNVNEVQV